MRKNCLGMAALTAILFFVVGCAHDKETNNRTAKRAAVGSAVGLATGGAQRAAIGGAARVITGKVQDKATEKR